MSRLVVFIGCLVFCCSAVGDELDVAVGWSKPPYVIADTNSGYELDLVRLVFARMGHTVSPIFVPFGRSHIMLQQELVDITLTINPKVGIPTEQLSDVYVTYQNVAISLKKNKITLSSPADIRWHSVVAFQSASIVLGKEFGLAAEDNKTYIELPEQRRQVEMLLLGNTDIVVMDLNIFNHLARQISGQNQMPNVDVHRLFPPNPYRAGFVDVELKNEFNLALSEFMRTEDYQALLNKYELLQ